MFDSLKGKNFWLYILAVFALVGFFSFVQVGARNSVELKHLPVAIVNESDGKQSQQIVDKLKDKFSGKDAKIKFIKDAKIKFINVKKQSDLKKGFNDKKYYAAFVIDKNFDKNIATQQNYVKGSIINAKLSAAKGQSAAASKAAAAAKANPAAAAQMKAQVAAAKQATAQLPSSGSIKVYINQGMSAASAQALTNALPAIGNGMNQGIAKKMQGVLNQNNVSLSGKSWQAISNPIKVSTIVKNKIPSKSLNGSAPMIIIVLSWLSSLIGSMLLWREHKKLSENGHFSLKLVNSQMITGVILAVAASLSIYFFASIVFGLKVPAFGSFTLLLMFNIFVFYLIQTCVLDWAGFAGWPLIIVVWFLSVGVLSYPPEMLSPLFRNLVYSWKPMRFSMDIFTNNLYINGTSSTMGMDFMVLSIIGIVALILIYVSSFVKKPKKA